MKKLIMVVMMTLLATSAMASGAKNKLLGMNQDFVIISDVEESEIEIFLSGAGNSQGACGISLRSNDWSHKAERLNEVLKIDNDRAKNIGQVKNGRLTATMFDPTDMMYGVEFTIRTKSGESIKSALEGLRTSDVFKSEVLVEATLCGIAL
ncbi:MAG: hypothetical protein E2O68_08860 [Deltaproteobacteria bacterium]|nr:MAG: hypothetical protein E2O68_08860 [Deltaproteobacteria bacterium]